MPTFYPEPSAEPSEAPPKGPPPPRVHNYSGLNCIRHQHQVSTSSLLQDFEMSKRGVLNNPISKCWMDADGSFIIPKIDKCGDFYALTLKFSNRSKWAPNVAIHPQNLTPRKREELQGSLFFLARKVDGGSRKISLSIRVIDENLRHWSYVENSLNSDLLSSVLDQRGEWKSIEVKLTKKEHWKLWDSDGNRDEPPDSPEFQWIVGVVVTVDFFPADPTDEKAGEIQIAKLGFESPFPREIPLPVKPK